MLLAIASFIVGASIGSFLTVVLSRFPRRGRITVGRSRCLHCGHPLAWYDMVPIVSYLVLRGRCRRCGKSFSRQYPAVEIVTGGGFAFLALATSPTGVSVWLALMWAFSVLIAAYDIEHQRIPNQFLLLLAGLVAVGIIYFMRDTIEIRVLSGLVLALFFAVLFWASAGRWIGGGDVKLALVLGFWVGWPGILVMLFVSYLVGALVGLTLLLTKKVKSRRSRIAFAPFLILGSWVAFLWGEEILRWYLSIII